MIAAEHLRKAQPESTVTIINDEPEPPYSRMAIPYYLIGRINEAGTYLRKSDSHFTDAGIDVVQGRVSSVDAKSKKLALEDGNSMNYDKLLIATGSHPIRPPIPGWIYPACTAVGHLRMAVI